MGSVERLAQLIPQPEVADGDDRDNEQFVVRGGLDAFDGGFHGAGRSETPPHRPFAFRGVIDDVSNDPTIPKSSSAGGRGRPVVATVADGGVDGKRVNITIAINIRCLDRNNADGKVAHQAEHTAKQSSSFHRERPKSSNAQPAQKEPFNIFQQALNTDVDAQRDLSPEPSAHSLMSEYADRAMQSASISDQPQCFKDQEAAKQPSKIDQETAKGDADVTPQPSVYPSTDQIRSRPRSDQLLKGTSGGREFSSPSASRASTSNATDGRSSLSLKSSTKEPTATHAAFSSDRTDANHQQKSPSGRRWTSQEEPHPPIIPSRNHRPRSTSFQPVPQIPNLPSSHRRPSASAPPIDLASSTFEDVRYIDDADAEQLTLVDGGPHQRWSSATASNGGDGGVFQVPIYHRAKMPRRQSTTGETSEREVEADELGGSLADRSSSASSDDDDDDNNNNTINKNNNNDHQRGSSPAAGQYARRSSPRSKDTFTLSNKNDSPHRTDDEVFEEASPQVDAEVDDGWPTTVDDSAASESDRHLLRNVFDYDKNEVGLLVTPQPNGDTMLQKLWWEDDEDDEDDDEDDEDDSRLVSLPTANTQHPLNVEGVTSEGWLTTEGASVAEEMPAGDLIATSKETARKKGNRVKQSGHMRRSVGDNDELKRLFDSAEAAADDDEEDIADALKRECAESAQPVKGQRRLLQRPTGAKNTLFVNSTAGEDKCKIARRLVEEVQQDGKSICRFLMRIIPVEVTCKFYLDDVSKAAAQLISKHFANTDPPPSYAVMYKSRNQDKLSRKDAIDIVTEAVRGVSPLSKVNLADPDKAVIIEATRTIVCMSVVTDFAKLRKYSLQPPAPAKEGGAGEGKEGKEDKEEEDKEQNDNEEEGDASGDEATDEKAAD
uniref:THUMP domain-containing protein n=1 Tax=Plectus sambesii TaxID=2011161 RepID=A0A914XC91_9BILA